MVKSQTIQFKDFSSSWYKKWSILLKQENGIYLDQPFHNKAWQNAVILQALDERGYLIEGNKALGFGVGKERVPSALAALGLKVTATDQDFESGEKGGWNNGQLARSRNDLNKFNITSKKSFDDNVEFKNCDMTKISKIFTGKYDLIWSNCALGHLGSIDKSLEFIENSLDCLKPGGIAIHTTETNVVSNKDTIETGNTVIFRRKDLTSIFYKLRKNGYKCSPLYLNFGRSIQDKSFSFDPYTDGTLLKLSAGGYLLSQMVLIIHKPINMRRDRTAMLKRIREDILNGIRMKTYIKSNPTLIEYIKPKTPIKSGGVQPQQRNTKLKLKSKEIKKVSLQFKNTSTQTYYDIYKMFHSSKPLMVATSNPVNRSSKVSTKSWLSPSRPNPKITQSKDTPAWGGIKPGSKFCIEFSVKAPSNPGTYIEEFCFTLEGFPSMPDSEFTLELAVS